MKVSRIRTHGRRLRRATLLAAVIALVLLAVGAQQSFAVGSTPQTILITAPAPTSAVYGSSFTVSATATSALDVTITASGGCSGGGTNSALIEMTSGTDACVVDYYQPGDDTFSSASDSESPTATPRPITVTAATNSKPYDGTTSAAAVPTITAGSLVFGDTASFTESYGTAAAGTGKTLNPAGVVLDGNGGDNYSVTFEADTTGEITKLAATWTTVASGKSFGAADPSPLTTGSGVGFLGGDGVTASYSREAGESVAGSPYQITAALSSTAGALGNYEITNDGADFTISSGGQTIGVTTAAPGSAEYGASFGVAASASSGLPVTISTTGGCSGGDTDGSATITMTSGTVSCVVRYNQAGNGSYSAAPEVTSPTSALKRAATWTTVASGKSFGAADPSPLTTGSGVGFLGGDGVTASYSREAGESVAGSPYQITAALSSTAGALGNYEITNDGADFTISSGGQTIGVTTAAPGSAEYGASFGVAASASSGLPVTISTTGGCSGGDTDGSATITMTSGTVSCVVRYNQAGNGSYSAAPEVTSPTSALKRAATWTTVASGKSFGAADPSPLTTGSGVGFLGGDGVTASYSREAGESVAGSPYQITAALSSTAGALGNYEITNDGADFTISSGGQTIGVTTAAPGSAEYGASFGVAASASSGLPVTISTTGGCSGGDTDGSATITMTSGTVSCVVRYNQAGNGSYSAAPEVTSPTSALKRAATWTTVASGKSFGAADPSPLTTGERCWVPWW